MASLLIFFAFVGLAVGFGCVATFEVGVRQLLLLHGQGVNYDDAGA